MEAETKDKLEKATEDYFIEVLKEDLEAVEETESYK